MTLKSGRTEVRLISIKAVLEVFFIFLRLGLTSFGGPQAHIGYFHQEFVRNRKWLSDNSFAEVVAVCQFLPGPASSQVGLTIGLFRAGLPGSVAAWLGFTLPSAILMTAFAVGISISNSISTSLNLTNLLSHILHGLKLAAVPIVLQALWSMAEKSAASLGGTSQRKGFAQTAGFASAAALISVSLPFAFSQIFALLLVGALGWFLLRQADSEKHQPLPSAMSPRLAKLIFAGFVLLLIGLPFLAQSTDSHGLELFARYFRVGSIVFGGGHVVLPMLQSEVIQQGLISNEQFLAGYGLAQAIPGPLFTIAGYLGAISPKSPNGIVGSIIALLAIFMPSFFLIGSALPGWQALRQRPGIPGALLALNAGVIGLLLIAFYNPVCTTSILSAQDLVVATLAFGLLVLSHAPAWSIVLFVVASGLFR